MIPPKQGLCSECDDGINKPIIKGLCVSKHYWASVQKRSFEKQKLKQSTLQIKAPIKRIAKVKKHIIEPADEEAVKYGKGGGEMWRWFNEQRSRMKGECAHCGNKTNAASDETFHFSIAHLLPKAYFPSVKTHPENWIELCFWGNNCHQSMDDKILDLTEMNCWDEIVVKFQKIYPEIAPNERRRIPSVLLQYLNTDQ